VPASTLMKANFTNALSSFFSGEGSQTKAASLFGDVHHVVSLTSKTYLNSSTVA
jgi:hypothetical protein